MEARLNWYVFPCTHQTTASKSEADLREQDAGAPENLYHQAMPTMEAAVKIISDEIASLALAEHEKTYFGSHTSGQSFAQGRTHVNTQLGEEGLETERRHGKQEEMIYVENSDEEHSSDFCGDSDDEAWSMGVPEPIVFTEADTHEVSSHSMRFMSKHCSDF